MVNQINFEHQPPTTMFPIRSRLSDHTTGMFREKSGSTSSIKSGSKTGFSKEMVRESALSIKERALLQGSGSVSGSPGRMQV